MKAEDLLKIRPYTLKKSETQEFLKGLGSVKTYDVLHDNMLIRRITMTEADAFNFVELLNYAFINGATQSILRCAKEKKFEDFNDIKKRVKKNSTGLLLTNNSVSGTFDSNNVSGVTGTVPVMNDLDNIISNSPNINFNKKDLKRFLVKIDDNYHLSLGDLLRLGFSLPERGTFVKTQDKPYNTYSNNRIYSNEIEPNNLICVSPFATEVGKKTESVDSIYISLSPDNFALLKFVKPIDKIKSEVIRFNMGI